MSLNGVKGTYNPVALLAEVDGARKIAVAMKPENGTVNRGTVCYKDGTGLYAPAAAADAVDTNQLVVLDETVDTDASASIASAAAAYREATLLRDKVKLAEGADVTAAVELVLRKQGLYLSPNNDSEDFDNET